MTKIIITNYGNRLNKGSTTLLNSKIRTLNELIPDANFTIFTHHPEIDYNQYDVKILDIIGRVSLRSPFRTLRTFSSIFRCILWRLLHDHLGLNANKLIKEKRLQEYYNADIIINTGGDVLTEDYGSPFSIFSNLLFAILLNKPVVIYAESIGSFEKIWNMHIARFILNRAKLITLREEISEKNLRELGINKPPIYVTADPAFLLEPIPSEKAQEILLKEGINKTDCIIGMSVSQIVSRYGFTNFKNAEEKYDEYINLKAQVVDYLVETLNATVVFVPHVIGPGKSDDRIVAQKIYQIIKHKQKVISINNEYTPEELKGVIGQCDLFVGARMHATIASTSMLVPTIAIAYSHKTHGIIGKMLGQEKYVLDIKELNYDTLISKINGAWNNKEEIKRDLKSKMKVIKERALLNGKLVKDLLHSLKKIS